MLISMTVMLGLTDCRMFVYLSKKIKIIKAQAGTAEDAKGCVFIVNSASSHVL